MSASDHALLVVRLWSWHGGGAMASNPTHVGHGGLTPGGTRKRSRAARVAAAAAAFESADGLVIALESDQTILYASDGWRSLFGESPDRPAGQTLQAALPAGRLVPEDEDHLLEALRRSLTEGPSVPIPLRSLSAERDWRHLEGRAYSGRALRDVPRNVWLVVFHDKYPHGGMESPRLSSIDEDRLRAEKLETLGVLAAGIAHDFSNLLTPIVGNASLLLADLPAGAPERRWAEGIRRAANRATALTGQMLSLAGPGAVGRPGRTIAMVDLSAVIRGFTLLLETTASKTSRIHWDLADDLPLVHGEPAQLAQIVVNLVANASNALGTSGGAITVRTGTVQADRTTLDACYLGDSLTPGRYVFVEVRDEAARITPEARAQLLNGSGADAGSEGGRGLGLGLSVVIGTVRAHEGALYVGNARDDQLEPDGGCFRVLLPVAREPDATARAQPS